MSVLGLDRPYPDLKNLLLAAEVWIRFELKHAARKIFDISVIAIVQAARLTESLVKIAIAGTMLAKVGSNDRECRPVLIRSCHVDGKAQRHGCRASFALHDFDLRARYLSWCRKL